MAGPRAALADNSTGCANDLWTTTDTQQKDHSMGLKKHKAITVHFHSQPPPVTSTRMGISPSLDPSSATGILTTPGRGTATIITVLQL